MSRKARSARGEIIDFDLLAIKDQLATAPVPVGTEQRRRFIDEKGGIKTKQIITPAAPSALAQAAEAAEASAKAAKIQQDQKSDEEK